MSTQNPITGDYITSRPNTKEFEDNFEKIFGKKKAAYQPLNQDDDWDEKRVDVIGSNGNDGEIYHWLHKHGHRPKSGSSETYKSWVSMKARCKNHDYYVNNNITVCERWNDFINFLADMGEKQKGTTIDRIDSSKGYYKENCRWATIKEQSRNKKTNHFVEIGGETKCLVDWARQYNIPTTTFYRRYHKGIRGVDLIKKNLHYEGEK